MKISEYRTSDLALAAFLMMKGLTLLSASKHQSGRFEFIFKNDSGEAEKLSLEFINSEFCKYDNHLRNLKKILYKS